MCCELIIIQRIIVFNQVKRNSWGVFKRVLQIPLPWALVNELLSLISIWILFHNIFKILGKIKIKLVLIKSKSHRKRAAGEDATMEVKFEKGCLGPCALTPPLCPLTLAGPLAHGHYNCKHQCMRLYLFLWVCAYNMALCACQWVCLCVARVCVSKFVCCCFSFCSLHLKKTPC